jgi:rsbT co-antagonist protein RsbR
MQFDDHVFVVPLIGTLDSRRTETLASRILALAYTARAELIILDISGVPVVDTAVASSLVKTAQALQLLGTQVSISGVSAQAAITLTHLGIVLSGLMTAQSPQEAIQHYRPQGIPSYTQLAIRRQMNS